MSALIYDRMLNGEAKLAVIGLGYVGLPIALDFARKIKVVGFDINQQRVDMMKKAIFYCSNCFINMCFKFSVKGGLTMRINNIKLIAIFSASVG